MKKFILLFAPVLLFLMAGCAKAPLAEDGLASFVGTRASAPLEGTIWEHRTDDGFNLYILFRDGNASLFYGMYGEAPTPDGKVEMLQRWSEFFTAPYTYEDGMLKTAISYRLWGNTETTESTSVVQAGDGYTLLIDGKTYTYFGPYTRDIETWWMTIFVTVAPWE